MAGPFLHRLMHTIFFTNKRVFQETAFRDGAASVSYAAVEMLNELTENLTAPKVLVVGVGEIGRDVVKNLEGSNIEDITITNRTYAKAEDLASECGYKAIPFEEMERMMPEVDVVISSISREGFFYKENVQPHVKDFKYFLDLSVPRSVSDEVEKIPGVLVYDVDDINDRTSKALEKRLAAVPDVKSIIKESVAEFGEWSGEMVFSDTIHRFKDALESLRQRKMAKYLKKLNEQEAKKMDKITKELIQDIVKLPVLELKAACKRGEAESLSNTLQDLFNLEKVAAGKQKA
jgi:glutamyl-tRNA reductase